MIEEHLNRLVLQELGLLLLTRLRVQAQLEEANAKLAATNELLVKAHAEQKKAKR